MNEMHEERSPADAAVVNPFQSPGMETEPSTETKPLEEISPTQTAIWGGVLMGIILQLFAWREALLYGNDTIATLGAWSVPALATGVLFGLGVALITPALMRGSFSLLLPGHWFLIAFIPKVLITIGASFHLAGPGSDYTDEHILNLREDLFWYMLPELAASLVSASILVFFYFAVLIYTREPQRWKVVAGTNAFYWMLTVVQLAYGYFVMYDEDAAPTFYWITNTLMTGTLLFWVLAILASMKIDSRQEVPRDGYHWIGIGQLIALPFIHFFMNSLPYVYFR